LLHNFAAATTNVLSKNVLGGAGLAGAHVASMVMVCLPFAALGTIHVNEWESTELANLK
jgi:hypothetical protein